MDEDDILIEVKLDDREITRQMNALGSKLQKSLNVALGGNASGGGQTTATRAIKDQETAALKLAQAQARLATATGDLSKAQNILNTALVGVNKTTSASISAQTQLAQVHNRMARNLKDIADTLQNIGSRLTIGLTLPIGALGAAAIKTAVDFDSLKRGLISVAGSAENAEKQLGRLKEIAKLPGLSFQEAIRGSINLQAAGFSAERAEKSLRVFGNALATVGKGSSELQGVITALTQIESKGKVSAEEINQLAERVPQIRRAIVAAFGTADTEVIQKAKITSRQFIDAVVTELDKLPKVTGGAKNTFENLKDSIEQALLPLGNKLLETILPAIEKLTPKLLGLLEGFQKLSPEVQAAAIGFGAIAFGAGPVLGFFGQLLFLLTQIRNLGGISGALGLGSLGGGLGKVGAFLGTPAGVAGGIAGLGIAGLVGSVTLSEADLNDRIAAQKQVGSTRGGRLDLQGNPIFATAPENFEVTGPLNLTGFKGIEDAKLKGRFGPQNSPIIDANALAKQNAKGQQQKSELDKARDTVKSLTEKLAALGTEETRLGVELAKINLIREKIRLLEEPINKRNDRQARIELGLPIPEVLPDTTITDAQRRAIGLPRVGNPLVGGSPLGGIVSRESRDEITANIAGAARSRGELADQRLRIQEAQIQNQINRGLLTEAEAQRALNAARRASRAELIATLEQERQAVGLGSERGLQITEEIERLRSLGQELSLTERFMRGFASATEDVGNAFERFGQNVSQALTNTRDLVNGLKNSVLQLFNDLLGQSLQNLVRSALAPLVGGLGGLFSGAGGGGLGNLFRTPSTFPAQFAQAFAGGGGSDLAAPPSISAGGGLGNLLSGVFNRGGGGGSGVRFGEVAFDPGFAGRTIQPSFLSSIGQSAAAAAPFLGLSLGGQLGGQSIAGQIAGSAGGLLGGGLLAAKLAPSILSKGAAAFFTNPFTIAIGAGLLVGSIFLSRAAQRKKDEQASGEFLTQALQGIEQLATAVATDQIEGSQARAFFDSQILNPFRQQISGLKTKSVVESRLKNQVNDLNKVYRDRIEPLITEQQKRRADAARFAAIDSRLVPQFDTGGIFRGTSPAGGLAILHPNEMVLTRTHQQNIRALAGPDIFERVGVPGVKNPAIFDDGGIMPSFGSLGGTSSISLSVHLGLTRKDVQEMIAFALDDRTGQDIIVDVVQRQRESGRRV